MGEGIFTIRARLCKRCGRLLTSEEAIKCGLGYQCAKKHKDCYTCSLNHKEHGCLDNYDWLLDYPEHPATSGGHVFVLVKEEDGAMTRKKKLAPGIIEQLESLKEHCQSMVDENDPECIWAADCDALAAAIETLRDVEFWKRNGRTHDNHRKHG